MLVSIVILGIGLVALGELYLASFTTYHKSRLLSLATQYAEHELELMQRLDFATLDTGALIPDCYPEDQYRLLPSGRGVRFAIDALPEGQGTVAFTPYQGRSNLLRATITITWHWPISSTLQVTITTLLTKREGT